MQFVLGAEELVNPYVLPSATWIITARNLARKVALIHMLAGLEEATRRWVHFVRPPERIKLAQMVLSRATVTAGRLVHILTAIVFEIFGVSACLPGVYLEEFHVLRAYLDVLLVEVEALEEGQLFLLLEVKIGLGFFDGCLRLVFFRRVGLLQGVAFGRS